MNAYKETTDKLKIEFFNKISKKYAKNKNEIDDLIRTRAFEGISRTIREFQNKHQHKGMVVNLLEAGCGYGALTTKLLKFPNVRITVIDFSEEMIKQLKRRIKEQGFSFKHIRILNKNIKHINLKENSFDIVVLVNVLVNFSNLAEAGYVIRNLSKTLKPGGIFFLSILNKNSFTGLSFRITQVLPKVTVSENIPVRGHTLKCLKHLLLLNNLSIDKIIKVRYEKNPLKINTNPTNVKNKILKMRRNKKEFFRTLRYLIVSLSLSVDAFLKLNSFYIILAKKNSR